MSVEKSKYQLQELSQSQTDVWTKLLNESEDGTIFHSVDFLKAFQASYRLFIVSKGTQEKAGILCQVDHNDQQVMKLHYGVIHDGFFFKKNFVDSPSNSKRISTKFEIIEFALEELLKIFKNITFSLTPEIKDIRPFSWVNYHSPNPTDKFTITTRYTSLLNIAGISKQADLEKNEHFKNISHSRRQEIRYGIKAQSAITVSQDYTAFKDLYRKMAKDYDPKLEDFMTYLSSLVESLSSTLRLYYVLGPEGLPTAAAIFSVLNNKACYLYGVTSKEKRESFSGSFILWEAFKLLDQEGVSLVDLEGVNSPQRGWFKLSFGGDIVPYFHVAKPMSQLS